MTDKIITAKEAKGLSESNNGKSLQYIMTTIEEYASTGKTEFQIRDKQLFKKWEAKLISLGYVFKCPKDGVIVLSWGNEELQQVAPKEEMLFVDNDTFSNFQRIIMNKGVSEDREKRNPLKCTDNFLEYLGINIWDGEVISMKLHIYTKKETI